MSIINAVLIILSIITFAYSLPSWKLTGMGLNAEALDCYLANVISLSILFINTNKPKSHSCSVSFLLSAFFFILVIRNTIYLFIYILTYAIPWIVQDYSLMVDLSVLMLFFMTMLSVISNIVFICRKIIKKDEQSDLFPEDRASRNV